MSDGDALRAAIRATPTDATTRLVYADWLDENDQPGGDLVRLLVGSSLWEIVPRVVEWFYCNQGWPLPDRFIASEWLWEVLVPARWPNPEGLRACVAAIAGRMLPVALRRLPFNNLAVHILQTYSQLSEIDNTMLYGRAARAAADVAELCLSGFGDGAGDAANQEYCEQVHVVAWTWLGLPPLRPAPSAEPPVPPPAPPELPAPPSRPWWRRLFGG